MYPEVKHNLPWVFTRLIELDKLIKEEENKACVNMTRLRALIDDRCKIKEACEHHIDVQKGIK